MAVERNGEAVGPGRLLEPAYEETVAGCLAVVAGIAYIEQHVLVLMEKLVDDGEEREPHFVGQSERCVEYVLLALYLHFVGRNHVDAVKSELLQSYVVL